MKNIALINIYSIIEIILLHVLCKMFITKKNVYS